MAKPVSSVFDCVDPDPNVYVFFLLFFVTRLSTRPTSTFLPFVVLIVSSLGQWTVSFLLVSLVFGLDFLGGFASMTVKLQFLSGGAQINVQS